MSAPPKAPEIDIAAPPFSLPGIDGETYGLDDLSGENGTVVVFMCNHCPFVKAVAGRMAEAAVRLAEEGVGFVAINANDAESYPEDSFDAMKAFAREHALPFPYLHDKSQAVARAWGAVCTPDFYGLDADGVIRYRGRLDAGRTGPPPSDARAELVEAMITIARTGKGPDAQMPSIGCSIKWKPD